MTFTGIIADVITALITGAILLITGKAVAFLRPRFKAAHGSIRIFRLQWRLSAALSEYRAIEDLQRGSPAAYVLLFQKLLTGLGAGLFLTIATTGFVILLISRPEPTDQILQLVSSIVRLLYLLLLTVGLFAGMISVFSVIDAIELTQRMQEPEKHIANAKTKVDALMAKLNQIDGSTPQGETVRQSS